MGKILSIIIPTYNMEKYLRKCLDSLIIDDEGMKQLEVLVINDGSKDSSSQIAHEYQEKYPETYRVIDKENGNYGSCINRGLKEATGKYVKVLDADDSFDTVNFGKYLIFLQSQNCDLIITDFVYVNDNDEEIDRQKRDLLSKVPLTFTEVLLSFNSRLICMHELTYLTSIFHQLNYHQTEGISYTDLEWCFLPMTKVNKVVYDDTVVYRYLIGRDGQSISPAVAIRSLSHRMVSGLVMARQFEKLKPIDNEHKEYLRKRITWSLGSIYYNFLVSYRRVLEIEELISYDQTLSKETPSVYRLLENETFCPQIPIRYIKRWRKQGNLHIVPFSVRCCSGMLSLYQKMKH